MLVMVVAGILAIVAVCSGLGWLLTREPKALRFQEAYRSQDAEVRAHAEQYLHDVKEVVIQATLRNGEKSEDPVQVEALHALWSEMYDCLHDEHPLRTPAEVGISALEAWPDPQGRPTAEGIRELKRLDGHI
jgi:precorrin-2 methylase